ncbi:Rv3212 family protein [Amycolatopsis minnesotensis]|uniref:Pyrroloquinoline-quinone binding quinoprotein n=1 Tax=Amycolatopsis minnesotensis TaxID=337894 RepID=A0ABN2RJG9_9PSEU
MSEPVQGGRHRRPSGAEPALGTEDVLGTAPETAGPAKHASPERARRSPWNSRRDRIIAVAIALVCLGVAVVVWAGSDSRATVSEQAPPQLGTIGAPGKVPGSLTEAWQAPSPATPTPVTSNSTVVTGAGGEVDGRDPATGAIRWKYARDIPLCTIAGTWSRATTLYRNGDWCSEMTQLDTGTGRRTAQRDGDAQPGGGLVDDGSALTAFTPTLLSTWRDDLVKTVEYGKVPALINADKQPRKDCTYGSVAAASNRIGVIERCEGDPGDRLTVYKANGKEFDSPEVIYSAVTAGKQARLVGMSGEAAAVALPQQRLLVLYGPDGNQRAAYPLTVPDADLEQDPPSGVPSTSTTNNAVYWFTGSKTIALAKADLAPLWTLDGALGPGTTFCGQLVVPIKGGIAVLDERTGATIRTVGVDRHGYAGPVRLAASGQVLLEQRGDTLVALR